MSWADIPTCKESGLDVDYLMLRGIFMPAGVKQEHVDYYIDLFEKVLRDARVEGPDGAAAPSTRPALKGKEYADWVANEEARHVSLMKAAGFIAK